MAKDEKGKIALTVEHKELVMEKICEICESKFTTIPNGKSRRYCFECSPSGISRASNITGIRRAMKRKAVKIMGEKCSICGYSKCISALEFHHINSEEKEIGLSSGFFKSWQDYLKELMKCILVCSNCHKEIHYKQ